MANSPSKSADYHVLERGWLSSNCIVFVGEHQTAVVDTGYCTHATQTLALVSNTLNGRTLDQIINTHLHSDHCGGNAALQARYPKVSTKIPPGQALAVQNWDAKALSYESTGQLCPRFGFDGLLQAGETIALGNTVWQIHSAPGHDPHSVILFEPISRTLISADALWENGFGVIFPLLDGIDALEEVAQTLDLIERLAPKTIIPGHGRVFSDFPSALARARSRLDQFAQSPLQHARYAAKVLTKYKLLELQRCSPEQMLQWQMNSSYFQRIHSRYFSGQMLNDWLVSLVDDLCRSQAAQRGIDFIQNTE